MAGNSRRLVVYTQVFAPMVGGIEIMSHLLADGLARHGFAVRLITPIPGEASDASYELVRTASKMGLIRSLLSADTYIINGMTLVPMMIGILLGKRTTVIHQTWLRRTDQSLSAVDRVKRLLVRLADNIAVSRAIADDIPGGATVIENCYDEATFTTGDEARDRDIVFAGRLVSDKGAHILVEALGFLRQRGVTPSVSIAGSGPEQPALMRLVEDLGLADQVVFLGSLPPQRLAETYRRHRLLACPSTWREPFGIVALEAAACGCTVVGTSDSGLVDAIGPCGLTVPRGDAHALADAIQLCLDGSFAVDPQTRAAHLAAHTRAVIFAAYAAYVAGRRS